MEGEYIIREAKVLSVYDEYDGMRIKVRLAGFDGDKSEDELPYCFPLLPKLIHINPKVGECVLIILEKANAEGSNRWFIGPILSQPYFYDDDQYDGSAMNLLTTNKRTKELQNPDRDSENLGTLPDREDIAILGRENTDVILKNNELRLRCGYKEAPCGLVENRLHYNDIDPAYIQMKYRQLKDHNGKEFNSNINIVADRINLLSRDSKNTFELTNRIDLITDEELKNILKFAHPLPYGDELINFLKKLIDVFIRHTHPYDMLPPVFSTPDTETLGTDLDEMLSKAIRIN